MALFIQLTRKGETEPTPLNKVDEELCSLLGVEVHNSQYVHHWLDFIGMECCVEGQELGSQALRDKVASWGIEPLILILGYLEENYTTTTWSNKATTYIDLG